MKERIYVVRSAAGNERLVKAASQAQALRHVARSLFEVYAAAPIEVVELMERGVKAEQAAVEVIE